MSQLKIFAADNPLEAELLVNFAEIAERLAAQGMRFERWDASQSLHEESSQAAVIAAYQADVDRLMRDNGFQSVDVINISPTHPEKDALRAKFLNEHIHAEDEVRFFVDGCGLFYVHAADQVFGLLCEKGDLISVPAGTTHWFDMGARPFFKCIRLFTNPEGWVAQFTGSDIASRFPTLDEF